MATLDVRALLVDPLKLAMGKVTTWDRKAVLIGVAFILLALALFWRPIENLFFRWGYSEELTHSYFIPVLTGWLLWERRTALATALGTPWIVALAGCIAALGIAVVGISINVLIISQAALVMFIVMVPGAIWGRKMFMLALVPMLYLVFMVPPPHWVITVLSAEFQLISSELGVWMIRMLGIPVFLSGNVIDLGNYKLQVVEACSGLRYLFPFMSLGVIAAYFYHGKWWERVIIVLVTIPITIVMNSFRIAMTGVLVRAFGPEQADGFLHMFEGWVVFLLCLVALFGTIMLLSKFVQKKSRKLTFGVPVIEPETAEGEFPKQKAYSNSFILIGVLALCAVIVTYIGTTTMIKPERLDLATLPFEFEGWESREQAVTAEMNDAIGADDFIITNMISPAGEVMNLYIAYVAEQKEGKSWHSPKQCLPGGGWEMTERSVEVAEMSDGRSLPYNRFIIKQGDYRQLVYYWYDQRGQLMANEFSMKISLMKDALVRHRKDGAMIRVMTLIKADETTETAEERLQEFMHQLHPKLPGYIPA